MLNCEHDAIIPIHAEHFKHSRQQVVERLQTDHRRDIAAKERDAQAYRPMPGTVSATPFVQPKPQLMTAWGLVDADSMPVVVGPKTKVQIDYDM